MESHLQSADNGNVGAELAADGTVPGPVANTPHSVRLSSKRMLSEDTDDSPKFDVFDHLTIIDDLLDNDGTQLAIIKDKIERLELNFWCGCWRGSRLNYGHYFVSVKVKRTDYRMWLLRICMCITIYFGQPGRSLNWFTKHLSQLWLE